MFYKSNTAFSLVELLITLALLGVIAAMCVPPLFSSPATRSNAKYTALARDTAVMVASAYEQYKFANGSVAAGTTFGAFTPYMSYLKVDNTTTIDSYSTGTNVSCATYSCLKLHNGAMLLYNSTWNFNGTNTTNANFFYIDPDGVQTDATTNGPGKALVLWLQYDGSMHSWGTLPATIAFSTGSAPGTVSATPSYDPAWFTGF